MQSVSTKLLTWRHDSHYHETQCPYLRRNIVTIIYLRLKVSCLPVCEGQQNAMDNSALFLVVDVNRYRQILGVNREYLDGKETTAPLCSSTNCFSSALRNFAVRG